MDAIGRQCHLALGIEHGLVLRIQHRLQRATGKREGSVEILRRNAVIGLSTQANAKTPGVRAL